MDISEDVQARYKIKCAVTLVRLCGPVSQVCRLNAKIPITWNPIEMAGFCGVNLPNMVKCDHILKVKVWVRLPNFGEILWTKNVVYCQ